MLHLDGVLPLFCTAHRPNEQPLGSDQNEFTYMHAGVVPPVIANVTGWLQENCGAKMTPRQHYELQDLFSVYVHRMPGFKGADETSLFYNRDMKNRCDTYVPHACQDVISFGSL